MAQCSGDDDGSISPSGTVAVVSPGQGRLRVWRGLTLAAASLAIPTAAHVAAGGGVPVQGPFLFSAALLSIACVALADRQRRPRAIAGVIGSSQPLVHGVLALSNHGTATIVPTPQMIAAHAAATVVLTVLLAGGETVLWSMAVLSKTVVGPATRIFVAWMPAVVPATAVHHSSVDLPRPRHLVLAAESPRRGPPVAAGI